MAEPAAVPRPRPRRGSGRRVRRHLVPQPALADRRDQRRRPTTIRGRPTQWCGRCSSVIDESCDHGWCQTLATHLGHFESGEERELRQGRRYAVARRLAGLFASYARQRPQLLVDWRERRRRRHRRRSAVAAAAVAGAAGPRRRRPAAHPPRQNPCHDFRSRRPTCRNASRCSATPGCRAPRSSCSTRSPPTTTFTCGCRTPATTCGQCTLGRARRRSPAATTPATARSHHPLLATLGRDLRELQRSLPADAQTDEYLGGP